MELVFILLLVLLMALALGVGYPVAFALPGASVLAIAIAALCGWLFASDTSAYFAQDGPIQWLSAGITNFRSLYWNVERDTLIAIPLFIFMGIMLQRSKIAEDLLIAMAQLFGSVPGGLGISVVLVGALLAATTGIVGATVIAMGLISLPAMLRSRYSPSLASGTICASGTLGQIIPPSIVLIILADQLGSSVDQANSLRALDYRAANGVPMPSSFDVSSVSAGDMFVGAFLPGLLLVLLYVTYIFIRALINPSVAPPVARDASYRWWRMLGTLLPPLIMIITVLCSIIFGIATVNQAGSIGAVAAICMAGYRLHTGAYRFTPACIMLASLLALGVLLSLVDINVQDIQSIGDFIGVLLAALIVCALFVGILWSLWRTYKIDNTLVEVMTETAKTTSMVFIILIGAAMLTSAFRGFGGEEVVKHYLTGIPGGFYMQFFVVMLVMFMLGFFLDFIEIAVVIVPIVAPILLADPSANVSAVWLGVMFGLNMQTSFLTPPFGFSLFYLRGVAPKSVTTNHIYRGVCVFIGLQLLALVVVVLAPWLVNYLPQRVSLAAETASPPINPRMQHCLQNYVFDYYDQNQDALRAASAPVRAQDISYLPADIRDRLLLSLHRVDTVSDAVSQVRTATDELDRHAVDYAPLHRQMSRIRTDMQNKERELQTLRDRYRRGYNYALQQEIAVHEQDLAELKRQIPPSWPAQQDTYSRLHAAQVQAEQAYRQQVDTAYRDITALRQTIADAKDLRLVHENIASLLEAVSASSGELDIESSLLSARQIEQTLLLLDDLEPLKRAAATLVQTLESQDAPTRAQIVSQLEALDRINTASLAWRERASGELLGALDQYDQQIRRSIGLRLQPRFEGDDANFMAVCLSQHRDISLNF